MLLRTIGKSIPIDRDKKILFFLYLNVLLKGINPFSNKLYFSFTKNNNRLIYSADGVINHGGIVDRMKGILTTYYLSQKNNFAFHIYHNSPLSFSEVWHNEKVNLEKIKLNPFKFRVIFISTLSKLEKFSNNNSLVNNKTYLIYCAENILAHQYPNGKWETKTRHLFNELIASGDHKIDTLLNEKYATLFYDKIDVVHYRCLNYFDDFDDSKLKPVSKDAKDKLLSSIINDAKKTYNGNSNKIFISDSRYLLKSLKENGFRVFSLESTKHMDNKGHKKEEYLNAYLENHLITKAKNVTSYILFHKEKPFNSHFAYYPSIIGASKFYKLGINVNDFSICNLEITK